MCFPWWAILSGQFVFSAAHGEEHGGAFPHVRRYHSCRDPAITEAKWVHIAEEMDGWTSNPYQGRLHHARAALRDRGGSRGIQIAGVLHAAEQYACTVVQHVVFSQRCDDQSMRVDAIEFPVWQDLRRTVVACSATWQRGTWTQDKGDRTNRSTQTGYTPLHKCNASRIDRLRFQTASNGRRQPERPTPRISPALSAPSAGQ